MKLKKSLSTLFDSAFPIITATCVGVASCSYIYTITTSFLCVVIIACMEIEKNILLRLVVLKYSIGFPVKWWMCVLAYAVFSIASMWGVYNYILYKMPSGSTAHAPQAPQYPHPPATVTTAAQDAYMAALIQRAQDPTATPTARGLARQRLDKYMLSKTEKDILVEKKETEKQLEEARSRAAAYAQKMAEYKRDYASYQEAARDSKTKAGITALLLEMITAVTCVITLKRTAVATQQQSQQRTQRHQQQQQQQQQLRRRYSTDNIGGHNIVHLHNRVRQPSPEAVVMQDCSGMTIREIMRVVKCGPKRATRIKKGLEKIPHEHMGKNRRSPPDVVS